MKKKSIAILLILVTLIAVISNVSLATGLNNSVATNTAVANTVENVVSNAVSNTEVNTTANVVAGTESAVTNEVETAEVVAPTVGIEEAENSNHDNEIMPISDEDNIVVDKEGWAQSDIYLFERDITYASSVDGNLYAMGQKVNISSSIITGNLFVMAEEVVIDADVSGSIYVVGNNVKINAGASDIYAAGGKIVLGPNSYVYRDVRAASDTLEVQGCIYRNLYSASDNINIPNNGTARIAGTMYYGGNLNQVNESQVGNMVKIETPVTQDDEISETGVNIITILSKIVTALVIIGIGLHITKNKEANNKDRNYVVDILIGVGLIVLTPAIAVLCMLTVVGIPVAIILLVVYILVLFFSMYAAAIDIAKIIMNKNSNLIKFIVALVIYTAFEFVGLIPVGGGIITFIIMAYGFKVTLRAIFPKKQVDANKTKKVDNKEKQKIDNDKEKQTDNKDNEKQDNKEKVEQDEDTSK